MASAVRSELVGSVLEVLVREGDEVTDGDPVVVLESVDTEVPVLAGSSGTVSSVPVSEGDVVQEGDVLAVLD